MDNEDIFSDENERYLIGNWKTLASTTAANIPTKAGGTIFNFLGAIPCQQKEKQYFFTV